MMLNSQRDNGFVLWSEEVLGGTRSHSLPPLQKRPLTAGVFPAEDKDTDFNASARDRRLPKLGRPPAVTAQFGGVGVGSAGGSDVWQAFVSSKGGGFADRIADFQANASSLQTSSAPGTAGRMPSQPSSRPRRDKARPTPRGITATQLEARDAYNSIDGDIAAALEARVERFVQRCEKVSLEEATGVYVLIERCHSCEQHHKLTTRHCEEHYSGLAQDLLKHLRDMAQGTIMEVGEMLCQLEACPRRLGSSYAHGLEIWHTASRVGAFEVYLLAPDLKLVEFQGTVVQFPAKSTDSAAVRAGSPSQSRGSCSWGAQLLLERCGYVATLLHSKLSSKSWPTTQQITQRLFASLPRAVICVRVLCPSGQPLPHFTVEVLESEQPQRRQTRFQDTEEPHIQSKEEPVHMVVQATQGTCQIQEVPLHTPLELRIYHSTMRVQTVSFVASRLRMNFAFGADIVFRLWSVEVPGGLSVCASVDHIQAGRLPDNAKPFDGYVEATDGEVFPVKGRMQIPWDSFRAGQQSPASAFRMLRRISVTGYHSSELELHMQTCTVHHLYQQECLEIAILAAPEMCLTVVLPGSRQPVSNVRVEITAEQQRATTNERGQCWIILRRGKHKVRLLHEYLTAEWVQQELTVDSMEPRLQVPLPLKLKIWQVPLTVCEEMCAYDLWVSAAGSQPEPSWTPFSGDLAVAAGEKMHIEDGTLCVENEPVEVMDDMSSLRPPSRDPLSRLSPLSPFSCRIENNNLVGDSFQNGLNVVTSALEHGPLHLGTCLRESPVTRPPNSGEAPASLVVRSMATCCGQPVTGIRVDVDSSEQIGLIEQDGVWEATGLSPGKHKVEATHIAFLGGAQRHSVCLAKPDGRPELPLLFEACICLFAIEGAGGRRLVQAAGSTTMIPIGAMAFKGKVKTDTGELQCIPCMEGGRLQPVCVRVEANPSNLGSRCPVTSLQVMPEMPNYQWSPINPPALSSSRCGLCQLIEKGPITLGSLRPLAVASHIDGREFVLPIEEYSTIGHVKAHLTEVLNLGKDFPLALASEDSDGGVALPNDEVIRIGQRLCTLVCLEARVVFGSSDIGIPGATLVIDGRHLTHMRRTDENGRCEFGIPAGSHTITASHPMLDGAQTVSVELDSLFTTQRFVARPRVTVYAVSDTVSNPLAPINVWVCTQPGHIPAGAKSVAGSMTVLNHPDADRSSAVSWKRTLNGGGSVGPIDLGTSSGKSQSSPEAPEHPTPAGGLAFDCHLGDHLWIPDGNPWLLQDAQAWTTLLTMPLRVGILRPPVTVRCHGFGTEVEQLRLPADTVGSVSKLFDAVAAQFNLDAGELTAYCRGTKLTPDDPVEACSEVDVWPLALLNISVCTRCCSRGVQDVSVFLTEANTQNAFLTEPGTDPSYTNEKGVCQLVTHVGQHTVCLKHPAIFDPFLEDASAQMIVQASREAKEQNYSLELKLFVFCICSASEDADDARQKEVWICARPAEIPADAQSVAGVLRLAGDSGPVFIALGGKPGDPVILPDSCGNLNALSPCPLLKLSIDVEVNVGQLWCPELPSPLARYDGQCGHLQLLSKPICAGIIKPVVTVHCDTGQKLYVPLQDCDVVEALRMWVAKELGKPADDVGIFNADGELEDDAFDLYAGQEIYAGLLAELEIAVVVPEAAAGDETQYGLQGVTVENDGEVAGTTNEQGICKMTVRCGPRGVMLHHPCFGSGGRALQDVPVVHGQRNRRVVLADVRVYIFASKADIDPAELSARSPTSSPKSSPKSASNPLPEEDEEPLGQLLVWICSSSSQIQGDMVPISGRVWAKGLSGCEVSATLERGATELILFNGEEAEAEVGERARCTLSSLRLEVARAGYCWRQRDPPPLVERAAEIGGCEYLRLLACPTVIGYLDPAFCVEGLRGDLTWLPITEQDTVLKVKQRMQEAYDGSIPVEEMALCLDGEPLEDAVEVQAGWKFTMLEMAAVQLRVVTGCCCEPFDGVGIFVDGELRGKTDAHGRIAEISLTNGLHKLRLEHVILGKHGFAEQEISVARGKANLFTILPDTRLFVYATDPDPEEAEYEDDLDAGDEEPMPDLNSALDSSCVWLAADPGHVPDDAVPLQGCVVCETAAGNQVSAMLAAKDMVPVLMRLTSHMPSLIEPRCCKLASLRLECARRGHCWLPRDPSPLVERVREIGGCEFLRVLACPVSLGFLKPAVTVQCAGGLRLALPLSTYSNFSSLREHVAQQLGTTDVDALCFETVDGVPFTEGTLQIPRHSAPTAALCLLCARRGESIEDARTANAQAEAADAKAAQEAELAVAARAEREATQALEVLEASTRETSWLADLSASMRDS